jgi:hypothetical protein
MEPRGRNQRQSVANRSAAETAKNGKQGVCGGLPPVAEVPSLRRRGSVPLLRRGYFLLLQSGHEHWSQPLPVHASRIMCASYPQPIQVRVMSTRRCTANVNCA